ncbi:HTH_Tnp_Tc3_2 domain-containing protein [Trichonephila clavipes]|nr:HTH_Tnp_Tc3_2 domain-containing protein [Trichonephila clavipes]
MQENKVKQLLPYVVSGLQYDQNGVVDISVILMYNNVLPFDFLCPIFNAPLRTQMLVVIRQKIEVALFFGVHHSAISRLWKQFQTTQTIVRWPVGGRPRVTTPAEDRYIAIVAKRNRRVASTRVISMVTASTGKAISAATVRRRLHMNGLYPLVP